MAPKLSENIRGKAGEFGAVAVGEIEEKGFSGSKVSVGGGLETVDTGEVGDQEAPAPGVGETC